MAALHRFFWSVKGRMPSALSVGFVAAIYVLLAFGDFVPRSVGRPLSLIVVLPLLFCLVMVYTYFAIAIPLLAIAYLGGLFPDAYSFFTPYALSSAVLGTVMLALGIAGEVIHAKEKKAEIVARYGARLPHWLPLPLGILGLIGGIRGVMAGTFRAQQFIVMMFSSLVIVVFSLYVFVTRRRRT